MLELRRWQVFREPLEMLASSNFTVTDRVLSYFTAMYSGLQTSVPQELQFNDLRDAESRPK
jgi:hypothetical protein